MNLHGPLFRVKPIADVITLTVIPEPHTIGLLLSAAMLLALRRRGA